jgi:peptidoglycan/LPS O-acetylase OafA/YrhL
MHSSPKSAFAGALRGPAALCVVANHFMMGSALLAAQYLGQFGVAVFFLISGFVIPISLTRYDSGAFLVARALRIYPTYAVALTITLGVLWLSRQPLSDDPLRYVSNYLILGAVLNEPAFVDVVWTLEVELHFYLLCVIIAPWIRECRRAVLAMPADLVVLESVAWYVGSPLAVRLSNSCPFLIFMFGGVSAFYFVSQKIGAMTTIGYCLGCLCPFALALWIEGAAAHLPILAPAYCAAATAFLAALLWRRRIRILRVNAFFSRISYPLYVVRTGFGLGVLRLLLGMSYPGYVAVMAGFAAAVSVATIVHVGVEAPTRRLGQRLAQDLTRGNALLRTHKAGT